MSDPLTGIGALTAGPLSPTGTAAGRGHPAPNAELRPSATPSPINHRPDSIQILNARQTQRSETAQAPGHNQLLGQAPADDARRDWSQGVSADDKEMVDKLSEAVEKINEMLESRQMLTFQLDEESGRMVIRVIDAKTNEVIRQIPSEETLNFAKYVDGLIGLIFNKKA